MQYRKFGKLDWKVSALGFGCMRLPFLDGNMSHIDQDKVNEMVQKAVQGGVNYFDTAYVYHEQQSEASLGTAIKGYRDQVRIATKSPVWMLEDGDDFDRKLDEQLKRLQTDTIDFYLLHALDAGMWEKSQKLDLIKRGEAAKADGRIRYFGFSFHDTLAAFKQIIDGYAGWDFCQIQYNYMDVNYQAGIEGLQYAASKGLAVVTMESLRGGKLAADLPSTRPLWDSTGQKRTPAEWAFRWLWNQPEVSVTLSGMGTLQQVEENIASANSSGPGIFTAEEMGIYDQAREIIQSTSPIPCTGCSYCMPCPNGVNIPGNFETYNQAAMYEDIRGSRFAYGRFIPEDQRASNCVQCESCLSKCPQHIQISSWLPVVHNVLGLEQEYVKAI